MSARIHVQFLIVWFFDVKTPNNLRWWTQKTCACFLLDVPFKHIFNPVGFQIRTAHSSPIFCTCSGGASRGKHVQKNGEECAVLIWNPTILISDPNESESNRTAVDCRWEGPHFVQLELNSLKSTSTQNTVLYTINENNSKIESLQKLCLSNDVWTESLKRRGTTHIITTRQETVSS